MGYLYKKTREVFLSKSGQKSMKGEISKIRFSKGLLIKSPILEHRNLDFEQHYKVIMVDKNV